jgi:hypothetical protein
VFPSKEKPDYDEDMGDIYDFALDVVTILVDSELTCAVNIIGESTLGLNKFVCCCNSLLNSLQGRSNASSRGELVRVSVGSTI